MKIGDKMTTLKLIEDDIDIIQKAAIAAIEKIYIAGMTDGANDALECAAKLAEDDEKPTRLSEEIRSLKK